VQKIMASAFRPVGLGDERNKNWAEGVEVVGLSGLKAVPSSEFRGGSVMRQLGRLCAAGQLKLLCKPPDAFSIPTAASLTCPDPRRFVFRARCWRGHGLKRRK